jgi:hypothetical protein
MSINQFSQHVSYPPQLSSHRHITTNEYKKIKMINLSHMISILNFVFTILFYVMRWTKQYLTCIYFTEFLNQKSFESNFQFSGAQKFFPVFISFSIFFACIHYSIFLTHLILSTIIFSSAQSTVRPNRAFSPLTQFSLDIFDLQPPATTFGLSGCRTAFHCVIYLWHCGAASPPPPLPLQKWLHPITSSSLFLSPVTGDIKVPLSLPPSP